MARALFPAIQFEVVAPGALPAYLSGAAVWQWVDVPNSKLSDLDAVALASYKPPGVPASKVIAWNGGALKRQGSVYMLGAAGGHGDYSGNEVNAIALNVDAPAWQMLKSPTLYDDLYQETAVYKDLRRAAVHTYQATQFDQARNRMLICSNGGVNGTWPFPVAPAGWPWPKSKAPVMAFDLGLGDWLHPDTLPPLPDNWIGTDGMTCCDPATNDVYLISNSGWNLWRYPVASGAAPVLVGGVSGGGARSFGAFDPNRRRLLLLCANATNAPKVLDANTAALLSVTFGGLGAAVLTPTSSSPRLTPVYDEANDCYLVLKNSNPMELYRVDAETWVVDQPIVTGTKPGSRQNNIQNACQYVPELRGIVLHNRYSENVKFMRTSP